ncbi:hypothetical protein MNBD_GAMMA10-2962, partial [hydrothermal vent metagenome]
MERAVCEQCDARQSVDWRAGDLCSQCGHSVRQDVRCGWCTAWTPNGKFCRECGTGLVSQEQFGAARMLKHAGVDQFTLAQRLAELDPEQVVHFQRLYQKHWAVALDRVSELRLCEAFLLQPVHAEKLEHDLIKRLPLSEQNLEELSEGPKAPFVNQPERILEIANNSPIDLNRTLANLAWMRCQDYVTNTSTARSFINTAKQALYNEDPAVAIEAAAVLAHWRHSIEPFVYWIEWDKVAEVGQQHLDSPVTQLWAALAVSKDTTSEVSEKVKHLLEKAKQSSDKDLAFSAALYLQDNDLLAQYLDADSGWRVEAAATALAKNQATVLGAFFETGKDTLVRTAIKKLLEPINPKLIPSLLKRVTTDNEDLCEHIYCRIKGQLEPSQMLSLINVCEKQHKVHLLSLIVESSLETCPDEIISAVNKLDLLESHSAALESAINNQGFDLPLSAIPMFNQGSKPERQILFVHLIDVMLRRHCDNYQVFYNELVKLALESDSEEVVAKAASTLHRNSSDADKIFVFTLDSIENIYPDLNDFIQRLTALISKTAYIKNVSIEEWVTAFLNSYDPEKSDVYASLRSDSLQTYLQALVDAIGTD